MSLVNVTNVVVLDNPTQFTNPFQFEITFECLQDLTEDLEWKVIYVGSSESSDYDQTLEEVLVGPVTAGCHKFILQADAPDPTKLLELLGVTVVLIACSYQNHEFVRIGYYVNNELQQEQQQQQHDDDDHDHDMAIMSMMESELTHHPFTITESQQQQSIVSPLLTVTTTTTNDLSQVIRTILADKPRVTRFTIPWHSHQQSQDPNEQSHMNYDDDSVHATADGVDETMTTTPEPVLIGGTTNMSSTDNTMTLDPALNGTWMARIVSPTNHDDDMDF